MMINLSAITVTFILSPLFLVSMVELRNIEDVAEGVVDSLHSLSLKLHV